MSQEPGIWKLEVVLIVLLLFCGSAYQSWEEL